MAIKKYFVVLDGDSIDSRLGSMWLVWPQQSALAERASIGPCGMTPMVGPLPSALPRPPSDLGFSHRQDPRSLRHQTGVAPARKRRYPAGAARRPGPAMTARRPCDVATGVHAAAGDLGAGPALGLTSVASSPLNDRFVEPNRATCRTVLGRKPVLAAGNRRAAALQIQNRPS